MLSLIQTGYRNPQVFWNFHLAYLWKAAIYKVCCGRFLSYALKKKMERIMLWIRGTIKGVDTNLTTHVHGITHWLVESVFFIIKLPSPHLTHFRSIFFTVLIILVLSLSLLLNSNHLDILPYLPINISLWKFIFHIRGLFNIYLNVC